MQTGTALGAGEQTLTPGDYKVVATKAQQLVSTLRLHVDKHWAKHWASRRQEKDDPECFTCDICCEVGERMDELVEALAGVGLRVEQAMMPEWLREIEEREKRAFDMVVALCRPRGTEGSREWIMSVPARPDYDPDLVIGAALRDNRYLLSLVRQMGEALRELHDEQNGPPLVRRAKQWEKAMASAHRALQMYEHGPEVDEG